MSLAEKQEASSATRSIHRLEKWALFAEIAGGVAVVLSVIYLALQVSDNNRLLRSQAHYNALELAQRPFELMLEDENLAAVMVDCESDPESVSRTSWERCSNDYFIQLNSWEYLYYQHDDESIPPQLWRGADAYFRDQVRTNPGYAKFWSRWQIAFDDPFRTYVANEFAAAAAERK